MEVEVSRDRTIALQSGQQTETPSQKKKEKQEYGGSGIGLICSLGHRGLVCSHAFSGPLPLPHEHARLSPLEEEEEVL